MTTCLCVCVYFRTVANAIQFYLYDDDGSTPPVAEMDIFLYFTVLFGIGRTWELKCEFDDTKEVYVGIVHREVHKDNPKQKIYIESI